MLIPVCMYVCLSPPPCPLLPNVQVAHDETIANTLGKSSKLVCARWHERSSGGGYLFVPLFRGYARCARFTLGYHIAPLRGAPPSCETPRLRNRTPRWGALLANPPEYPRWESNPDQRFRKPPFYPLNYRGCSPSPSPSLSITPSLPSLLRPPVRPKPWRHGSSPCP